MKTPYIKPLTCQSCEHVWFPRSQKKPVCCPNCQSRKWDKPKVHKGEDSTEIELPELTK